MSDHGSVLSAWSVTVGVDLEHLVMLVRRLHCEVALSSLFDTPSLLSLRNFPLPSSLPASFSPSLHSLLSSYKICSALKGMFIRLYPILGNTKLLIIV